MHKNKCCTCFFLFDNAIHSVILVNSLIIPHLYDCQVVKLPIIHWEIILVKFLTIGHSLLMLACYLNKVLLHNQ